MGVADSPLRDRVVFVQGAPRSGTTWLVTLLATHPEIAGVEAESHLFEFGVDRLFDNFEGRDPAIRGLNSYFEGRPQLIDLVRDVCDGTLMAMRSHVSRDQATEPEFVVEKTPSQAGAEPLDLVRKRECYPDAHYLHIVRDGEAVIRSLMRAPWLGDRSRENCERIWSQAVEQTRRALSDHPRYIEVSYERLRDDPVAQAAEVFDWLGVESGEPALANVRALSAERFSDRGAVTSRQARADGGGPVSRLRRAASATNAAVRRALPTDPGESALQPGAAVAFAFAVALRERDPEALASLTSDEVSLEFRSPEGDTVAAGDVARERLLEIAAGLFSRRHVSEWWATAGGSASDGWTGFPGRRVYSVLFSALGGDATRTDVSFALFLEGEGEEERITRVTVVSAGPLAGRPIGAPVVETPTG